MSFWKRTRKGRRTARKIPWLAGVKLGGRILLVATAALLVGVLLYRAFWEPAGFSSFRVAEVEFQGIEADEIESLRPIVEPSLQPNILHIDLQEIRDIVESTPWVKTAVVRRRLPDRIQLSIVKRSPRAIAKIGNELVQVDEEGRLLGPPDAGSGLPEGPIVLGLSAVEEDNWEARNARRMELYLSVVGEFSTADRNYAQEISEIDVADPHKVAVIPMKEPVPIYLGASNFLERYKIFLSQRELYQEYKQKYGHIESVDVSFDKQIILQTPGNRRTIAKAEL